MSPENRRRLADRIAKAAEASLAAQNYVSPVDVLVGIGWLDAGAVKGKVTRASRNDVAVDADAQSVVVLILDVIDRSRLGCAGQRRIGHVGAVRCRLQLLVDHIEAHI